MSRPIRRSSSRSLSLIVAVAVLFGLGGCEGAVEVFLRGGSLAEVLFEMFSGRDQPPGEGDDQSEDDSSPGDDAGSGDSDRGDSSGSDHGGDDGVVNPRGSVAQRGEVTLLIGGGEWTVEVMAVRPAKQVNGVVVEMSLDQGMWVGAARFDVPAAEWPGGAAGRPALVRWVERGDQTKRPEKRSPMALPHPLGETGRGLLIKRRFFRLIPVQTRLEVDSGPGGRRLVGAIDLHAMPRHGVSTGMFVRLLVDAPLAP